MNPVHWLGLGTVRIRTGDGYLLSGRFSPAWDYDAPSMISLGPAGQIEWARTYMTDSTEYGSVGARFTALAERSDGGHIVAMDSKNTIGIARLDAMGAPVWHKRYPTEMPYTYSADLELEPDGSITLLGHSGTGGIVLMRTGPDGEPQWAYTYTFGPMLDVKDLVRSADGSYYATIYLGCLMHFNSDGTYDWIKNYNRNLGHIELLPNGDLLATSEMSWTDSSRYLIRFDPEGEPLAAWASTIPGGKLDLLGLQGDSVFVLQTSYPSFPADTTQWAAVTIATSVNDLSCAFTPSPLPTVGTQYTPVTNGNIVSSLTDELKSWTINVGETLGMNIIDITAQGSSGPARPGFGYVVYTETANLGGGTTAPLTRTLTFDPLLTYVSASPEPTSVLGNTITWSDGPALGSYAHELAYVEFTIPPDPSLIGSTLTHTYSVTQDSSEYSLANNTTTINREITSSYDPNDKLVSPRNFYHIENDSILDYTIQFQNTGSDTAFTVVVRDTLPLDVDTRTFKMGTASHPYTYSLTGNGILTFTFENILLPDSNTNEPMSHGLVNFRIKPIQPLSLGQEITNTADIYFDFNPPIHTPAATVVVTDETGVHPTVRTEKLQVFPVPVKGMLNAVLPAGFDPVSSFAIGVDGRRVPVFARSIVDRQAEYRTDHLPPGAYVLTLHARNGRRLSARFVKE